MAETITISDELARRIRERVDSGRFKRDSEVLEAALDQLDVVEAEEETLSADVVASIRAALDDPGPRLTTEQVRQSIERHHAEALRRHGKV